MEKVAIYCRLSDEDRNKASLLQESESIQNQKHLLLDYAMERKWDIYGIYSDDDYSGLDKDRPQFNQMLRDAQEGRFQIILCKHQSRFSRDMEVIEKYLHNKFPAWGIRFISVTDHADTLDKGNKKSRQIQGLVNEWYCEDISEAIKATFRIKRQEGKFIGAFAPYGYSKSSENKNKLIIDQEASIVVQMIFDWYLKGYGTQHIANRLNKEGIPNPTQHKQKKGLNFQNSSQIDGYGLWNKTTIRRMLRNEIYIGNMVQGKGEKINYKSKKILSKPKKDWIVVKGTHEAIIDKDTFHVVQEKLNNKVRSTKKGRAHLFASKLRCMDCGSTMNKVQSSQGRVYLRCKLYTRDPLKKLCTSHSVRLDLLKKKVAEELKKHLITVEIQPLVEKLKQEDHLYDRKGDLRKEKEKLEKQMGENKEILKNLYIDKVKGWISLQQFRQLNEDFLKEKIDLQKRIEKKEREVKEIEERDESGDRWFKAVERYRKFDELSPMMVQEWIDFIEVGEKNKESKEQKIRIYWNFSQQNRI